MNTHDWLEGGLSRRPTRMTGYWTGRGW